MAETSLGQDFWQFICCLGRYLKYRLAKFFLIFEKTKSWLAASLYRQRGRWARPFIHSGMALLVVIGVALGPVLISEGLGTSWQESVLPQAISLATASTGLQTATLVSAKPRAEVIEYKVQPGDTISTIAEKFGISVDTIRWENDLKSVKAIKEGQILRILPVTGLQHKVKRGENIYSIAKKYQIDAQSIVDWPYNSFANDETFALAVGQILMAPDAIKPKAIPVAPRDFFAKVPGAGVAAGTGQFVWPTSGRISQGFRWYHKAIDIANKAAPDILVADSGVVVASGWPRGWGYGNRVMVDHGNGFSTLYAHLSKIYVQAGQKVNKGQALGKMGSTGRSTGVHLHFELKKNGISQDPLAYLK